MRRIFSIFLVLPMALWVAGCEPDGDLDVFSFSKPAEGQLSLAGPVATHIVFPTGVRRTSLQVTLDGEDVTHLFTSSVADVPWAPRKWGSTSKTMQVTWWLESR